MGNRRLADMLGVDLAEALREDGEDGRGCARELRFDSDNVGVGEALGEDSEVDVYVYEEGLESGDRFTKGDEEEDEEGEGDEGEIQGSDFKEVEVEGGAEDEGAEARGSSFITPKKNTVLVNTVFGVEEEVSPSSLGMVFGGWDELDTYFWSYARQKGFGIVRADSGWVDVKKELEKGKCCKERRNAKWTCDCYGYPSRKRKQDALKEGLLQDEEIVKKRKTKKCGCPVKLYASVNKEGNWVVRRLNLKHKGHIVTPGKSKDVAMYRKHELMVKNNHLVKQVHMAKKSKVKESQMYSCYARERNGVEEMTFTQRDFENAVAQKTRLELTKGDANGMIEYFNKISADNQSFFHLCRFWKDDALQDVVWVDARSRAAYEEFGDVVCFDSTYFTNKFHLPFAVFIGVNHHGQSILFGCALISRETAETCEWVLRTWLHCMGGKAPISILTDQDPAIRKVVNLTMPESCHRWCIWHILQKFSRYVGKHEDYEAVKDEFESIIYGSLDADEFVDRWADAIDYYKLGDNSWLEGLYEERNMWIPAYLKHLFWAGMKTTQPSESFNHLFKGYVDKHTTLSEFVLRYCDAMQIRVESERIVDSNTIRYVRHLATDFPGEEVFRKCYTDAKFKEVQRECQRMLYVRRLDDYEVGENQVEFVIEDQVWIKPKHAKKEYVTKIRRCYRVHYDSNTYEASCDCKHFECHGIICRHMIFVYDHCGVSFVPEKYILRRWRKDI
ncbi:protein FAR-RED IMPAIRED RESPONSE 1-like [Chenopodium quinoa]|uniref:protein FAR-RED IMPAIRED RESPONSE 1-like n=1 Tax=Chenopodium quinoa TaxID=63459 RepID=UPI000B76CF90|nr:protein FAR-RED IMPAIRED RESPONSE 1-like [Chenopodium quinoa]